MADIKKIDPARIKALALDLDGTVLRPGGRFGEYTLRVLKGCMRRGIRLIFCTGRSVEGTELYRTALDLRGPMVYFNGAKTALMPGGTLLGQTLLDRDIAIFCVDLSRKLGLYTQIYFPGRAERPGDLLIADCGTDETAFYLKHTGVQAKIGDLQEALAAPGCAGCLKTMFIIPPEQQEQVRSLLTEQFGERIYLARTYVSFLEVMSPEASKGRGLKLAMDHLALSPEQVLALGDEENDLPLFAAAGFSAAPANARPRVLAAADFRVASNADEGPASFLETLFLGPAE